MSSCMSLLELRKEAVSLAMSGEWGQDAILINTRILEVDDHASDAYTRLARCFLEKGNIISAHDMYTQVLAFDAVNTIAINNLQRIKQDIAHLQELRDVSTICDYGEAFSVGVAARRRGKNALAIAALSRAVELQPDNPFAFNALGAAFRHNSDHEQARKAYETALNLSPNLVSLVGLAAVERDIGNSEKAMEMYQQVLGRNQDNPYALNGMGGVLTDLGYLEKAENYFRQALKFTEGIVDAVKGLKALQQSHKSKGDKEAVARIGRWLAQLEEQHG